jgi:hypothetical protein
MLPSNCYYAVSSLNGRRGVLVSGIKHVRLMKPGYAMPSQAFAKHALGASFADRKNRSALHTPLLDSTVIVVVLYSNLYCEGILALVHM